MEGGGSKTKSNFTIIWTINNFCLELVKTLRSPVFTANSIDKTKWKLKLSVPDLNSSTEDYITCTLQRENDERNAHICIDFQLSIMDKKNVLHTVNEKEWDFGMNLGNAGDDSYQKRQDLLKVDTLMKNLGKWVPDNALTLRCQMSIPGCNNSTPELCFARTIMNIEKRSFVWTIEDICSIPNKGNRIVQLKSYNRASSPIQLNLRLEKTNGKETFKIEMHKVRDLKDVHCEISNLNCEGKCVKPWCSTLRNVTFHENKCVLFQTFIKKEELEKNPIELTDGALILRCDFQLFFGGCLNRIENYRQKSGDFFATAENEEGSSCSIV